MVGMRRRRMRCILEPATEGGKAMNYIKIQLEAIKALAKGDTVAAYRDDDVICLTYDRATMYRIPDSQFYIKLNVQADGNKFFAKANEGIRVQDTWQRVQCGRKLLARYTTGQMDVWIDTNLLRLFDKDCKLIVTGPKDPVFVMEYACIAGLVMPCKDPHNAQQDN